MKKLSTNKLILSAFIDQNLSEASNPKETLWFKGTKLYSYESLLAIIDPANNVLLIDKDIRNYSNTTQKQTLLLNKLLPNNYTILSIPLKASPEEILMYYWNLVEGLIVKYNRATKHKTYYKTGIHRILQEAEQFVNYTSISRKSKEYKYRTKLVKLLFEHKLL